jgi:pilus assembly protein CpaE
MRAIVACPAGGDSRPLRQILLGAGFDCEAEDSVGRDQLAVRLAQGDAELVVVRVDDGPDLDWQRLGEAVAMTRAAVVLVGPADGPEWTARARQVGAAQYVPEAELPGAVDRLAESLGRQSGAERQRGRVIAVFAPAPGSGGSTVAANLAGSWAGRRPRQIALVELARDYGELALLLNLTPEHSAADVCKRWQTLDRRSLGNSFQEHAGGFQALLNGPEGQGNAFLRIESVRRIAMLARTVFGGTVLALDARAGAEEIEAMRLSDAVVLVVRADVVGVRRAQAALRAAADQGVVPERFRMVVNRWGQRGQLKLKEIEGTLGLKAAELVPDDPGRCNQAANRGALLKELWPRAAITRKFDHLAELAAG